MSHFYLLVVLVVLFAITDTAFSNPLSKHGNGILTGRVVYPDGKPAAGIRVVAVLEAPYIDKLWQKGILKLRPDGEEYTEEGRQFFAEQQNLSAVSQADGSFHISGLITGPYDLLVTEGPGKFIYYMIGMPRDWTAAAAIGIWGKQGHTVQLSQNIILTHGIMIQGKVIDTDGKPLEGIEVASIGPHRPESSDCVACVITDEKGEYSMRVPPGDITVYIAGPSTIHPKLKGKVEVTLNDKPTESDRLLKAQCRFHADAEKSDAVNFRFLPS